MLPGGAPAAIAVRPSEASQRFLRAVREANPDERTEYPDEGIPEAIDEVIARNGSVAFTMGSSAFMMKADGVAACTFPSRVRPINWHYLRIFLEQFADAEFVNVRLLTLERIIH